jgi:hypothetical protein
VLDLFTIQVNQVGFLLIKKNFYQILILFNEPSSTWRKVDYKYQLQTRRFRMDLIVKQIRYFSKTKLNTSHSFFLFVHRFLQNQAKEVLINACQQTELNKALCYVDKKPGNVYYYYRRKSGEKYLTIMSPKDWGDSCPFEFLGGEFFLSLFASISITYSLSKHRE